MAHQNLFEALERITGFIALESDMFEIIDAVDKDRAERTKPIDMETKQTAVNWLMERLPHSIETQYKKYIDQAKQLEKQQIVDAVDVGFEEGSKFPEDIKLNNAEQYYFETYGKDN